MAFEHAAVPRAERDRLFFRPLDQQNVARPCDRLRETAIALVVARFVEHQIEYDDAGAGDRQRVDELRMQAARPRIELRRLADGTRRVARDPDDDDVGRRRPRAANAEQPA